MLRAWIAGCAAFVSAGAAAQPVFFDDFEGSVLLPHWNQPPPTHWQHSVGNGMLSVTGLLYPSNPHAPGNFAGIDARFAPQADFRVDVWMGWEAGQQPHRLELEVGGPFGGSPIIALFGYRHEAGTGPSIIAGASNQSVSMPAPPPGLYHFAVTRTSGQFEFYLNGSFFAGFPDTFAIPAAAVHFFFVGPYPGQLGSFHIDRVRVIPGAGGFLLLPAWMLIGAGGRRRWTPTAFLFR